MNRLLGTVAACAFAFSLALASNVARATDYADLWWNPLEDRWGLQTSQQGDSMFITLYVFRADRSATWFNGLMFATAPGGPVFAGDLSQATGPYFGSPTYAPPGDNRTVGTVTFTATSPTTATVTYSVDGVTVTKNVQRLTLASHNLSGTYIGSFLSLQHSCANPLSNGPFNGSGTFTIAHNLGAQTVIITAVLTDNLVNFTCTYQGAYSQLGKIGSIAGTYSCTSGQAGAWNAAEIEVSTLGGILGRYSATNAGPACQITGGFGGLKPAL
jgi:hypothetical protein